MREIKSCVVFLLVSFTGGFGCPGESVPEPEAALDFSGVIKQLMSDSGVGGDEEFRKIQKKYHILPAFVAPAELRLLLGMPDSEFPGGIRLQFQWEKGHVALFWRSESFRIHGAQPKTAKRKLTAFMQQQGFKDTAGKLSLLVIPGYARQPSCFSMGKGKSNQEVIFPFMEPLPGSDPQSCGSDFTWAISHPYSGAPPTLKQLFAAVPTLKPGHFPPGLYDCLQDNPAFDFSTDCEEHRPGERSIRWYFLTTAEAKPKLEKALAAQGFLTDKRRNEPSGVKETPWRRESDWASTTIKTFANQKERIEVSYQAPQKPLNKAIGGKKRGRE